MGPISVVTFFGSGKIAEDHPDYQEAFQAGKVFASAGFAVCNGGYGGIMEASARGTKEVGGRTIGITTAQFPSKPNPWIDEEKQFPTWRDRLFGLIELGDAYVFFGGGTGTLTELFVVWEMTHQKILQKPVILLGKSIRSFAAGLGKNPQVIFNPHLKFAETPEKALSFLLGESGR